MGPQVVWMVTVALGAGWRRCCCKGVDVSLLPLLVWTLSSVLGEERPGTLGLCWSRVRSEAKRCAGHLGQRRGSRRRPGCRMVRDACEGKGSRLACLGASADNRMARFALCTIS